MNKRESLEAFHAEKFAELCRMLSFRLSLGPWGTLSRTRQAEIEHEAVVLIEEWDVAGNIYNIDGQALSIDTPLQKLLVEIHEIEKSILDERDAHW